MRACENAGRHHRLKFQRRGEEESAHRSAVLVVVARRPAVRREAQRAHVAARVGELGGEDRTVAGELMIVAELFFDA